MICPSCGSSDLHVQPVYYDAMVSETVDYYLYICEECGFEFMVKEN